MGRPERIADEIRATEENFRLGRDGGFKAEPTPKPIIWPYDPQVGSSFVAQRIDSRFKNRLSGAFGTSVRRKAHLQFVSKELSPPALWVKSKVGGEKPLPGPGEYTIGGTFGRPLHDARKRNAARAPFDRTARF